MAPRIPGPGDVPRADLSRLRAPDISVNPNAASEIGRGLKRLSGPLGDFAGNILQSGDTPDTAPEDQSFDDPATRARESGLQTRADVEAMVPRCAFFGAEERRIEAGLPRPGGLAGLSTAARAAGVTDKAVADAANGLERRGAKKETVETFRLAGEKLREQDRQRGADLDLAEAPALVMEAFTETVLGIGGAVRNDLNAGNDGFFTMGKASDGLKDVVSAETQKSATRQAQEFLAAQHIAGQIDRDPEGTHEGFQTGRFKDSPVHPVTLAGLRDKAERRAREARRARQGALEAERTRALMDLEERVEMGEAGPAELDARHAAGEIDTTRRDRLASRAELRRAEAERQAEQRNAIGTVARGEAEGGNPSEPSYRRAVDDYYKSTLLPQLGPQSGLPGAAPDTEARIAERLGMFVARTGVLPSRLKAIWGKAIRDVDPNALKNATPEQRQRAATRAAQAAGFIAAIDKSAPGLIDREIADAEQGEADGQSILARVFTRRTVGRARTLDEIIGLGLSPTDAMIEAQHIEEEDTQPHIRPANFGDNPPQVQTRPVREGDERPQLHLRTAEPDFGDGGGIRPGAGADRTETGPAGPTAPDGTPITLAAAESTANGEGADGTDDDPERMVDAAAETGTTSEHLDRAGRAHEPSETSAGESGEAAEQALVEVGGQVLTEETFWLLMGALRAEGDGDRKALEQAAAKADLDPQQFGELIRTAGRDLDALSPGQRREAMDSILRILDARSRISRDSVGTVAGAVTPGGMSKLAGRMVRSVGQIVEGLTGGAEAEGADAPGSGSEFRIPEPEVRLPKSIGSGASKRPYAEALADWWTSQGEELAAERERDPNRVIQPAESFIWKNMPKFKGREGIKTNQLTGKKKRFFTFDRGGSGRHQSEIEVFDRNENHLGTIDPLTGQFIKGPDKTKTIDLSQIDVVDTFLA